MTRPWEILPWREGDRMEQEIQTAPCALHLAEQRLELARYAHVAGRDPLGAEPLGDGLDPALRLFVEIGRGKARAAASEGFGAARSNAVLIGDADDQAALSAKIDQGRHITAPNSVESVWSAIMRSSSVGTTHIFIRLSEELIRGPLAAFARSSTCAPSHSSRWQMRARTST